MMESDQEQNDHILERFQADVVSADFHFSLLVAALSSYRHDTVLRPFPSSFNNRENNNKDYRGLVSVSVGGVHPGPPRHASTTR
jgi:hypothetical protein